MRSPRSRRNRGPARLCRAWSRVNVAVREWQSGGFVVTVEFVWWVLHAAIQSSANAIGRRQSVAFPLPAIAVAVARTLWWLMPRIGPNSIPIRITVGMVAKYIDPDAVAGDAGGAAQRHLGHSGFVPDEVRRRRLRGTVRRDNRRMVDSCRNPSATAPARAAASAAFCAWRRLTHMTP